MTNAQEYILKILGSEVFGATEPIPDPESWREVLDEAQYQTVFLLVYAYAEKKIPAGENDKRWVQRKFTDYAASVRNLRDHGELHKLLSAHDIPYVILKGQASAAYYPEPKLRTMGDVDFLVSRENIKPVEALLEAEGFSKKEGERHYYHEAFEKGRIELELHWDVPGLPEKNDERLRFYLADILDNGSVVTEPEGSFRTPSKFHHGLVLLLHTISHMTNKGVGLRHLCDWLAFENSLTEEEFTALFEAPLKDVGLWTFARVLTQTGVLHLGCKERAFCAGVDPALCTAFLEDIFKGGNFGVKDDTRKSQAKLIQNDEAKTVSGGGVLKNALISVHTRTKRDFPVCEKLPVLYPLGWLTVLVQYACRVATGKRNNVFNKAIFTDAMNRQAIYAKLRLFERDG